MFFFAFDMLVYNVIMLFCNLIILVYKLQYYFMSYYCVLQSYNDVLCLITLVCNVIMLFCNVIMLFYKLQYCFVSYYVVL